MSGDVDFRYVNGRGAKPFFCLYNGGYGLTSIRGCFFARNDTAIFYDCKANDSLRIHRSEFFYNNMGVVADSNTVIDRCFLHDNQKAIVARRASIYKNRLSWNDVGLISGNCRVVHNRFFDNTLGITQASSFVALNRFLDNLRLLM